MNQPHSPYFFLLKEEEKYFKHKFNSILLVSNASRKCCLSVSILCKKVKTSYQLVHMCCHISRNSAETQRNRKKSMSNAPKQMGFTLLKSMPGGVKAENLEIGLIHILIFSFLAAYLGFFSNPATPLYIFLMQFLQNFLYRTYKNCIKPFFHILPSFFLRNPSVFQSIFQSHNKVTAQGVVSLFTLNVGI